MVTIALTATLVILLVFGYLLVHQIADGILESKRSASVSEATTSLTRLQQQLRSTDLRAGSLYERLNQLADDAARQSGQYQVIIESPVSGLVSGGISVESVPPELAAKVAAGEGIWTQPTTVLYADPDRPHTPGIAVGSTLWAPGQNRGFPIYFIFPESDEAATLAMVQRVVISLGGLILLAMGLAIFLPTRQMSRPIRRASIAASRLAGGHLDERMPVRGTDDLARLATSMNGMAAELQRQINELENLSSLQQQFVSDVSHELRTPLTTVRMAADLLIDSRDDSDPDMVRAAELLHDELGRGARRGAARWASPRCAAGGAVLAGPPCEGSALVADEAEAARPLANSLETPLVVRAETEAITDVDARRIRRIIRNLIANALEHGESRPVEVTVAANDEAVAVTVRDHGIGFEPSQAEMVFVRFWRADPSRVRSVGGTGLGLAISLEDAHLHHGWLEAWGRPGRGAQFRLTLPRRADQPLSHSPLPGSPDESGVEVTTSTGARRLPIVAAATSRESR